eukprot:14370205-Alexandrium_andersonii.AAC.1
MSASLVGSEMCIRDRLGEGAYLLSKEPLSSWKLGSNDQAMHPMPRREPLCQDRCPLHPPSGGEPC